MNPHKKVDRLKQLSKVFLYFTTTSQSQVSAFLLSTKQDTEHMHSCHSGKSEVEILLFNHHEKKMSQRKGWIFKHIKNQALLHN